MFIGVDDATLQFETWNLRDLKHFCIVGHAFYDRSETVHVPVIQRILKEFLKWYDSHWLQPRTLPTVKDDQQRDWILMARELVNRVLTTTMTKQQEQGDQQSVTRTRDDSCIVA
jgi:hypothetical protein